MSLVDDIAKALGLKKEKASPFMTLTLEEKALFDKLKLAGLNPTAEDVQAFFQTQKSDVSAHAQIERIRKIEEELTSFQSSFIVNGSFESDFVGWVKGIYPWSIDTTTVYEGLKSLKITGIGIALIYQNFDPHLSLSRIRAISLATRTTAITCSLQATIVYDDETTEINMVTPSVINTWEVFTLSYNRTKKIKKLCLVGMGYSTEMGWFDAVTFWF